MSEVHGEIRLAAENIGGIRETSVRLSPGVNALVGRNASNRSSFLQAVMAACGSRNVSLKSDADEGRVDLEIGGETYTRTITRTGSDVLFEGDSSLEETTVADLFAFLLESNEARQAVARQDDLREVIMRPVDTEEITAEIERLEEEKRQFDDRLDELADLEDRLPELEQERQQLQSRLADKEAELEAKRAEVEAADADLDETREEKSELESLLAELGDTRSELENVRYDLDTQRERLTSLEDQREDLEEKLASLPETPAGRLDEVESELDRLRQRKRQIESDVNELQSVIQFNESRLEDTEEDALAVLDGGTDTRESVTDQLLEDETTTCWTCGSTVETDQIEETIDRLRELSQRKLGDVGDIESEFEDLQSEKERLENQQREHERAERKLDQTVDQIDQTEATIDDLEDRKDRLRETIEQLESDVAERENQEYETVLELHREANQLEFEVDQIRSDIADVNDEIEHIEEQLDERADLSAEREQLQSSLTDLRTRIDRLESEAVEAFNENMETVLELLDYENIDRIWIERVEREVREGRRTREQTMFDLHVVRSSASGAAYEDTIENLSESEREVTGLVFALAGYLTHDVAEECPFMLLDSLEAIDSDRIAKLVEYFTDEVPYLVVALLPEDAAALEETDRRIEEI
jgi:chromosome segregation ATPase